MTDTVTETITAEQTPTAPESDGPSLDTMSDAELDAFIKESVDADKPQVDTQDEAPPHSQESEPEAKEESQAEAEQTSKPEAEEPQKETPKEDISETEKNARLQKQLRDKELFIQRQAAQIGELRKQAEAIRESNRAVLESGEATPEQIVDAKMAMREAEQQLQTADVNEKRLYAQELLRRHVPKVEGLDAAMVEALEQDGVPHENLRKFIEDPISAATPGEILQLSKRAAAEMAAKALYKQNQELQVRLKELEGKPQRMMSKIDQAFNTPPRVTGGSTKPASSFPSHVSESDLAAMTDEQLNAFIKRSSVAKR